MSIFLQHPLISIGIPTYNRAKLLARAIESALNQDYPNLEILVSDNLSTDDTAGLVAAYASKDRRVRYLRQQENRGAVGNFRSVFENTTGEFFVWLGDDDWMDPTYVSQCADLLMSDASYAIVGGRVRYYRDDEFEFEEAATNLLDASPFNRVRDFYWQVTTNGIFYGLIRRSFLQRVPIRKASAFDWMVAAGLAGCGKCATLPTVAVHRALGGATKDFASIAASLQLPKFLMPNDIGAYTVISMLVAKHIVWTCPVFKTMGFFERVSLASRSSRAILKRYVSWHVKQKLGLGPKAESSS